MLWRSYRADPALTDFSEHEAAGVRMLVKPAYQEWVERVLSGEGVLEGAPTVAGGREEHPLVPLPGGGWAVVRRYRRGGLMRHINRETYFLRHRAFEEVRATERARAAGVRAPEVLAAVEWGRAVGYGALLATRWIERSVGLDRWIGEQTPAAREMALRLSGEQIGMMHRGGVAHPDLNLRNLLVSGEASGADPLVFLLDFDRANVGDGPVPAARRRRDLRRLGRSARKLGLPLGHAGWDALREGYGEGWPLDFVFG